MKERIIESKTKYYTLTYKELGKICNIKEKVTAVSCNYISQNIIISVKYE